MDVLAIGTLAGKGIAPHIAAEQEHVAKLGEEGLTPERIRGSSQCANRLRRPREVVGRTRPGHNGPATRR
jgi:hypothetical protein